MAEVDILMQEKQDDGSYNQLYPITNASNVNYTNSSLSGVSNAQQGLDSIVNTLGNINLNNYFTKTQTLTSATAALFGLGADSVPDDVLQKLAGAAFDSDGTITDVNGNPLGVRIATGSYVGTGTYGVKNPNSLTFGFDPKFLLVSRGGYGFDSSNSFGWIYGLTETIGDFNDGYSVVSLSGRTISWYNTMNVESQRNYLNYTYYYLAIG